MLESFLSLSDFFFWISTFPLAIDKTTRYTSRKQLFHVKNELYINIPRSL